MLHYRPSPLRPSRSLSLVYAIAILHVYLATAPRTRAPGAHKSPGGHDTPPRSPPRGSACPPSPGMGGSKASRGDAMGGGAPHLSGPLGDAVAHAASHPYLGLGSPALRPGRKPTPSDGGGQRSLSAAPSVAGPAPTAEAKTPSSTQSLKSLGVPP
jgi:hypothetical protein